MVVRGAYVFWGEGDCEDRLEVLSIPFETQQFPDRTSGKGTPEPWMANVFRLRTVCQEFNIGTLRISYRPESFCHSTTTSTIRPPTIL